MRTRLKRAKPQPKKTSIDRQIHTNGDGTGTVTVAFRCDTDFYQRLVGASSKDGRPIGTFVKIIVEDNLPAQEKRLGLA